MSERFLDKLFQAFEDTAVEQQQAAPIVTPADGDDYTYTPIPPKSTTSVAMLVTDKGKAPVPLMVENASDNVLWSDIDTPLTYAALVKTVYRLQNEVAGLAAQVVELRERLERWEADS